MKFVQLLNNRHEISILAREGNELADMIWASMFEALMDTYIEEGRA